MVSVTLSWLETEIFLNNYNFKHFVYLTCLADVNLSSFGSLVLMFSKHSISESYKVDNSRKHTLFSLRTPFTKRVRSLFCFWVIIVILD